MVLFRERHDIIRHLLGVLLDLGRLVVQGGGAVPYRVEQVGPRPVEHWHKVVADDLHPEGGQVSDGLLVVLDILVPGGQADLDVVVDVDALHHVHVEAVLVQLRFYFRNLLGLPDLPRHLVVERPDDALYPGDLLDVGQLDLIVAFAVPAPGHFHMLSPSILLLFEIIQKRSYLFLLIITAVCAVRQLVHSCLPEFFPGLSFMPN